MTPAAYLEWLDKEIERADTNRNIALLVPNYWDGYHKSLSAAKEKFLTIEYTQPENIKP